MTYVLTQPPIVAAAAADATTIGSAISAANATAAGATTGVLAAAEDKVSAAAATLFRAYAREYQATINQAAAFHDEFAALAAAGSAMPQPRPGRDLTLNISVDAGPDDPE
jgi:PE family